MHSSLLAGMHTSLGVPHAASGQCHMRRVLGWLPGCLPACLLAHCVLAAWVAASGLAGCVLALQFGSPQRCLPPLPPAPSAQVHESASPAVLQQTQELVAAWEDYSSKKNTAKSLPYKCVLRGGVHMWGE